MEVPSTYEGLTEYIKWVNKELDKLRPQVNLYKRLEKNLEVAQRRKDKFKYAT